MVSELQYIIHKNSILYINHINFLCLGPRGPPGQPGSCVSLSHVYILFSIPNSVKIDDFFGKFNNAELNIRSISRTIALLRGLVPRPRIREADTANESESRKRDGSGDEIEPSQ